MASLRDVGSFSMCAWLCDKKGLKASGLNEASWCCTKVTGGRGCSVKRTRWKEVRVSAKAVRERHAEIDKSEKLMEDPYGHVCEVMTKDVVTAKSEEMVCIKDSENATVWSMEMDVFQHFTGLPVVDESGLCVGVFTLEDYKNRMPACSSNQWTPVDDVPGQVPSTAVPPFRGLPVSAIMSTPAIVIKKHAPIAYVAALMIQHKVHRLPVVDETGMVVGIVSRTDIFEPLPEINPVYHMLAGKGTQSPHFTDE